MNVATSTTSQAGASDARLEAAIAEIRNALHGLRYGNIVVQVQDGVVVQIERTEKRRLSKPGANNQNDG